MRMRGWTGLLALLGAAGPAAAAAGAECRFVLECVDAEPCAATDYAIALETEDMDARLVTPAETVEGRLGVTPGGATFALALTDDAVHLLTIMNAAGEARYTLHLADAGLAITYHGQCGTE